MSPSFPVDSFFYICFHFENGMLLHYQQPFCWFPALSLSPLCSEDSPHRRCFPEGPLSSAPKAEGSDVCSAGVECPFRCLVSCSKAK